MLICSLLLSAALTASPQEPVITIPTEICRGYFFVPITLGEDGSDPQRTLWFLHDTGASTSFVDPDALERVSGQRVAVGRRANIVSASSGTIQYSGLKARVRELDHLGTSLGRQVDGILAFGVFDDFLLTLDYETERMTLRKGALPRPDGVEVFSADGPDSRPWLKLRVGDKQRRMLIDSGAALSGLVVKKLGGYKTLAPPRATGASTRLKEIEERRSARLAGNVTFGSHTLVQPVLAETDGTELIGGDVLRHFRWTFDQANERVRIERWGDDVPIEFAAELVHGMVLSPQDGDFVVLGVLEDGPADAAGIQVGDRITHFDGKPVATRGCEARGSDTLRVSLVRADRKLDVAIALFALVK